MENNSNEEIIQRLNHLEELDKKRKTRNIIILCCVLAVIVVLAIVLTPSVKTISENYNDSLVIIDKVTESLEDVDTEQLAETLKAVSEIDAEQLTGIINIINEIDTEKLTNLSNTINEISDTIEPIKEFFSN